MRKNFAVTVVKGPLSRKKNYVLCLDFKTHQLIIIKVKIGWLAVVGRATCS